MKNPHDPHRESNPRPACSAVSRPTAPPRTASYFCKQYNFKDVKKIFYDHTLVRSVRVRGVLPPLAMFLCRGA
jgi:enterochelin esterase-like enzyme